MSLESKRQEIQNSIIKWLDEEGLYSVKQTLKTKGLHYCIEVEYNMKPPLPFSIEFPTTKNDVFRIVMVIPIPENILTQIRELDEAKDEFYWDLITALYTNNCIYEMPFRNNGLADKLTVKELIYFDGCSKDRFMQAIRKILNAYNLAIVKFEKFNKEPRPREDNKAGIA
ncbi:MAG: hypothetical protein HMLIMOIP_000235 [Candidatus Nitrosomirales archaeon]|jgi:hypothetical protein